MNEATPAGELMLPSARGPVRCAYRPVTGAVAAVLAVGGTDGGLEGPADALYPDLAEDLAAAGIATLRVDFRARIAPGVVAEGVHDVAIGLDFLASQGIVRVGLVGHSFGGAVVIAAGAQASQVVTVATLASQTAGAQPVVELAPRPLLLIHGLDDIRLSADCSRLLYRMAASRSVWSCWRAHATACASAARTYGACCASGSQKRFRPDASDPRAHCVRTAWVQSYERSTWRFHARRPESAPGLPHSRVRG